MQVDALAYLASLCIWRGVDRDTLGYAEAAVDLGMDVGGVYGLMNALSALSQVRLLLGQPSEARALARRAAEIAQGAGRKPYEAHALLTEAAASAEEGDLEQALQHVTSALLLHQERPEQGGLIARDLLHLGRFQLRAGDTESARQSWEAALRHAVEARAPRLDVMALALLARLPGGDAQAALDADRDSVEGTWGVEVSLNLWLATEDHVHLVDAKRRLDDLVARAPEEYRESMLQNVRLHREIMEAWAEHGEEV
jgi:ATP/maltotriose-dependent transcriptional regulator MalT